MEILEIMEEKAIDILVKAITDLSLEHSPKEGIQRRYAILLMSQLQSFVF
jgi:hypothetical protein